MVNQDETLEDITANLLTGAMVFLLGAAMPTAGVWLIASRPDIWTAAPNINTLVLASVGVSTIYLGVGGMRWGLRMIRIHLTALRNRRPSPASG